MTAPKKPARMVIVALSQTEVGWGFRDGSRYTTERLLSACQMCHAIGTLTALPPPLLAEQPDDTTHVCNPALGGCNHGFAKEKESGK